MRHLEKHKTHGNLYRYECIVKKIQKNKDYKKVY